MRILKVLLLSLVVALAGCANDEPDDSSTPPADDGSTPPAGEGGDAANETPDDGANDTMEEETPAPAPRELHTSNHNFAQDPQGAPVTETFTVPEGYQTLYLNVTFTPTGVGVANSASVSIAGPGGGSASCTPTTPLSEAEECAQTVAAEAGEWTLTYSGAGTLSAAVSVAAS